MSNVYCLFYYRDFFSLDLIRNSKNRQRSYRDNYVTKNENEHISYDIPILQRSEKTKKRLEICFTSLSVKRI